MSKRRRNPRPATQPAPAPPPPLNVDEAYNLGDNLLRALTPLAGDRAQVDQLLTRWLDTYDSQRFTLITAAAIRTVFADCLYPTDEPSGALGFTTEHPEEIHA